MLYARALQNHHSENPFISEGSSSLASEIVESGSTRVSLDVAGLLNADKELLKNGQRAEKVRRQLGKLEARMAKPVYQKQLPEVREADERKMAGLRETADRLEEKKALLEEYRRREQ